MSKYFSTLLAGLLFIQVLSAQVPQINNISPAFGNAGTTVTINGFNFSPVAENNIVYFGTVRATVTAATTNALSVTIPYGHIYQRVTVTVNALTGYSAVPFTQTFVAGTDTFSGASFDPPDTIVDASIPCFADFDGDGLVDIAGLITGNKIAVFRNIGTPTDFKFAAGVEFAGLTYTTDIVAGDFNGDGKMDIAAAGTGGAVLAIYKNESSNGSIAFGARQLYALGGTDYNNPFSLATGDIDGDGKTDLVIACNHSGYAFSVARNSTVADSISFATRTNYSFGTIPSGTGNVGYDMKVVVADIDGDGKVDVTVMTPQFRPILIYPNSSVPGTVSFGAKVLIQTGRPNYQSNGAYGIKLADLDGDNKIDIGFHYADSSKIMLFRNTSVPGTISYDNPSNIPTSVATQSLHFADLDGDAKPEMISLLSGAATVYKNNSSSGNLIFGQPNSYTGDWYFQTINSADLDHDGKPEIVLGGYEVNSNVHATAVFRNLINGPSIKSITPLTAGKDSVVTIKGTRFTTVNAVGFGGIAAASFTVVSDSLIRALVGNGASGDIAVSSPTGIYKYAGFTFTLPVPSVISFAPMQGPLGTVVTIKGKNFSTSTSGNIVYFGAVKAAIVAASDTSIAVVAPSGTSNLPISVTVSNSNLTAYSNKPFVITFNSNVTAFSNLNFSDTVNYATASDVTKISTSDFDGDGKADIAASISNEVNHVAVFKNLGTNSNLMLGKRMDYSASGGTGSLGTVYTLTTDIDGDGKQDMVSVSYSSWLLSIFRNSSTADSISFEPKKDWVAGTYSTKAAVADLDNDGKTDVVTMSSTDGGVSIFKNTSSVGNISFSPKTSYATGSAPQQIVLGDFDNDGWQDMAAINYNSNNLVLIRNTSIIGSISFAEKTAMSTSTTPVLMTVADLNNDGKLDIIVANSTPKTISVFRNTSTFGNITFAPKVDYSIPTFPRSVSVSDLDGDGKPDIIAATNNAPGNISLFKNISVGSDSIILATKVDVSKTYAPTDILATDVNGDGKPDLVMGTNGKKVTILKNNIGNPVEVAFCPPVSSRLIQSDRTGSAYQWQLSTDTGYVNLSNNSNYSGTTGAILYLSNVPSSWYGNKYRCVVDGTNSYEYTLKVENRWTGAVSNIWENPANWSCNAVPDVNTDVVINTGNVVINSNVSVRSIRVRSGAVLKVNDGFVVTVQ